MSLGAMPLVVLNLGGEMIYILSQRLESAGLSTNDIADVLGNICVTISNEEFLDVFFKPQEMYGRVPTLALFERMCQAASIGMNEASFGKMYDLMLMGFKHQIVTSLCPTHLLGITLNHVRTMKIIVAPIITAVQALSKVETRLMIYYKSLSLGGWLLIRQSLLAFVQGKHDKILAFLDKGLQDDSGRFRIDISGMVPPMSRIPGIITMYHNDGGDTKTQFFNYGEPCEEGRLPDTTDPASVTELGKNLYTQGPVNHISSSRGSLPPEKKVPVSKPISLTKREPVWDKVKPPSVQKSRIDGTSISSRRRCGVTKSKEMSSSRTTIRAPNSTVKIASNIDNKNQQNSHSLAMSRGGATNDNSVHGTTAIPTSASQPAVSTVTEACTNNMPVSQMTATQPQPKNVQNTAKSQGLALLSRLIGVKETRADENYKMVLSFDGGGDDIMSMVAGPPKTPLSKSQDDALSHKKGGTSSIRPSSGAPQGHRSSTHQYRQTSGLCSIIDSFKDIDTGSTTPASTTATNQTTAAMPQTEEESLLGLLDLVDI